MDQMNNQNFNQMPQRTPGHGFSIASMVCGICSIVFCWCYGIVSIILGIVAIVLFIKAKNLDAGVVNGMAKAGLICGIIGGVLGIIALIYYIVVVVAAASAFSSLDGFYY